MAKKKQESSSREASQPNDVSRNIARSLGEITKRAAHDYMPTASSAASYATTKIVNQYTSRFSTDKSEYAKGYRTTVKAIGSFVKGTTKNAIDDLRTGRFYFDRDTAVGSMMAMYGDETSEDVYNASGQEFAGTLGDSISANMLSATFGKTLANGADYISNVITATSSNAAVSGLRQHLETMSVMSNIQAMTKAQVDFNNNEMRTQIQSSLEYYSESLNLLKSINDKLDVISSKYGSGSGSNRKSFALDEILGDGMFNASAYLKEIRNNAKTEMSGVDMLLNGGLQMLKGFKNNPIGSILRFGVNNLLVTEPMRKAMKGFDNTLAVSLMKMMQGANKAKGQGGIAGVLGRIFGIDMESGTKVKSQTYLNKEITLEDEQKKVKAITEVIPAYLSGLYQRFTGQNMIFNYDTGKFASRKELKRNLNARQEAFDASLDGLTDAQKVIRQREWAAEQQEYYDRAGLHNIGFTDDVEKSFKELAEDTKRIGDAKEREEREKTAGEKATDAADDIRRGMIGTLADKIQNDYLYQIPLYKQIAGKGGLASLFNFLSSKITKGTNYVTNQIFSGELDKKLEGLAKGGISKGGIYRVGEQGEELAYLPPGAMVVPHGPSMRILKRFNGGIKGLAEGTVNPEKDQPAASAASEPSITSTTTAPFENFSIKGSSAVKGAIFTSMLGIGAIPGFILGSLLSMGKSKPSKQDKEDIKNIKKHEKKKESGEEESLSDELFPGLGNRVSKITKGAIVSSMLGLGAIPGAIIGFAFSKPKKTKEQKEAEKKARKEKKGDGKSELIEDPYAQFSKRASGITKGAVISSILGLGPIPGAVVGMLATKKKMTKEEKRLKKEEEEGTFYGNGKRIIRGAMISSMLGLGATPGLIVESLLSLRRSKKRKQRLARERANQPIQEQSPDISSEENGETTSPSSDQNQSFGEVVDSLVESMNGQGTTETASSDYDPMYDPMMATIGYTDGNTGQKKAANGTISRGGIYRVGEQGEELAYLAKGSMVVPHGPSMKILKRYNGSVKGLASGTVKASDLEKPSRNVKKISKLTSKILSYAFKGDRDKVIGATTDMLQSTDTTEELSAVKNVTDIVANTMNSAGQTATIAAAAMDSSKSSSLLSSLFGGNDSNSSEGWVSKFFKSLLGGAWLTKLGVFGDAYAIGGIAKGTSDIKNSISTLKSNTADTVDKDNAIATLTDGVAYTAAGTLKVTGAVARAATTGKASGFIGKLTTWIVKLIRAIAEKLKSKIGKTATDALAKSGEKVAAEVTKKTGSSLASKSVQFLAKYGQIVGWAITIAQAAWDFYSGYNDVNNIMQTSYGSGEAPASLKITCGLAKALSGFLFGLVSESTLANLIYPLIGSTADKADLVDQKLKLQNSYNDFIAQHPEAVENGLTLEKYNDITNVKTSTKFINTIKGWFGKESASLDDYISSGSGARGVSVPYFSQNDSRWKSIPFGTYNGKVDTIGRGGCGPATAAMLIKSLTGADVNPVTAAEYAIQNHLKTSDGGVTSNFFKRYGRENSIDLTSGGFGGSTSYALKNGYPVALMGKNGVFGPDNHWVLATKINGNKIDIYDPLSPDKNGSYNLDDVKSNTIDTVYASRASQVKIPVNSARGAVISKRTEDSIRAINSARGIISTQTGNSDSADVTSAILNVLTIISENIEKIGNSIIGATEKMTSSSSVIDSQKSYSSARDSKIKNNYYSSAIRA